mmetsp:Transcript_3061/g.4685  ORF Transcript_3061/g.4685 Transcript_3061/m.4685 type:complete len:320 (+) Transcript_3061:63-1022(+)
MDRPSRKRTTVRSYALDTSDDDQDEHEWQRARVLNNTTELEQAITVLDSSTEVTPSTTPSRSALQTPNTASSSPKGNKKRKTQAQQPESQLGTSKGSEQAGGPSAEKATAQAKKPRTVLRYEWEGREDESVESDVAEESEDDDDFEDGSEDEKPTRKRKSAKKKGGASSSTKQASAKKSAPKKATTTKSKTKTAKLSETVAEKSEPPADLVYTTEPSITIAKQTAHSTVEGAAEQPADVSARKVPTGGESVIGNEIVRDKPFQAPATKTPCRDVSNNQRVQHGFGLGGVKIPGREGGAAKPAIRVGLSRHSVLKPLHKR